MRKYLLILCAVLFTFLNLSAQQTTPQAVYVDENFNGVSLPTNWVNNAISGSHDWKFGIDGSNATGSTPGESGDNNINGTRMAYFDDDSLGNPIRNNTPALETPSFDNSSAVATYVEFDYNFRSVTPIVPSVIDSLYLEAFDGTNWNVVWSTTEDDCGRYFSGTGAPIKCVTDGFPHAKVNISAYKNANAKVRFVYHDGNDWAFYAALDNVIIYSPQDNDLNAGRVVSPVSNCGLTTEQVQVMIHNTGGSEEKNFDVRLNINNGSQILTETITDSIPPQDSFLYTFNTTVDFSVSMPYDIAVITLLSSDTLENNDSTLTTITNDSTFVPAYFDSFESFTTEWTTDGEVDLWEWGFPNGRVISAARRGNLAWVTSLDDPYPDNISPIRTSNLISPCFDFTTAIGDPIMSFDLFTHMDIEDDRLFMETSIDNGQTWQTIDRSQIATRWYNNSPRNGWNRNQGGWVRVENVLTGLAGEGQVKIRFAFTSDSRRTPYKPYDGAAIDGFQIVFPDSVNLRTKALNYPIQGFVPECGYSSEIVSIQVENRGATDVDSFIIAYQIDNNPIEKDTIFESLQSFTAKNYEFKTLGDFSITGNSYRLSVWVEAAGDGTTANDSIQNIRVDNFGPDNNKTPLKADFDNWTPGSILNNENDLIKDGWERTGGVTWRVANSGAFTDAATGPNADHTGNNGNFVYMETTEGDSGAYAILSSPCVNFSDKQAVQLDYWYYRYGAVMSSLVIDVFDGTRWVDSVDVVAPRPQTSGNDNWSFRSVNLDAFAGKKIRVRFTGQKRDDNGGGGFQGDIAIDDVRLYEPARNDVEFLQVVAPISDCSIGSNSTVTVDFLNFGSDTIATDSLVLTCVYYPKSDPFLADTLIDTVNVTIQGKAETRWSFRKKANIALVGEIYVFDVWSTLGTDKDFANDSLFGYEATNFTKRPGYVEKFESNDFIDGNCLNEFDDFVSNGWTTDNSLYAWNLQNARTCIGPNGATPTLGTGPAGDHTTGEGTFFYAEASNLPAGVVDTANLISPCIDFTNSSGAAMAFWYHMYGIQMGKLYVDVLADGVWWNEVDSLIGQQHLSIDDSWILKGVNLGQFAGKFIQVRFRAIRSTGSELSDIAIDDIEFFEPIRQDARVSKVITPITECSPGGTVKIVIENFGLDTIVGGVIEANFRANNGQIFSDTIQKGIGVGDSIEHTFSMAGDFSQVNTLYTMLAWTELENDSNINDTLTYRFRNITQSIFYRENFESFRDGACNGTGDLFDRGWYTEPSQTVFPLGATWRVQNASACGGTAPQGVGPQSDGTNGRGNFMYLHTQGSTGNTAGLYSPCIDFTNDTSAGVTFKYHIGERGNARLYLDILTDTGWTLAVDSIVGFQQRDKGEPWREKAAKLEEFAGQEILIRFRGVSPINEAIAIDDISFYLPQPNDAKLNAVLAPASGCELFENSIIEVEIENFGTDVIVRDSLMVYFQIDDMPPVGELAYPDTVYKDTIINGMNTITIDSILTTINLDTIYHHTFTLTGDLSGPGQHNIKTWTSLNGEQVVDNDTNFFYYVFNETKRTNYAENFEGFIDASCTGAIGQAPDNGWVIYNTGDYRWNVQSSLCGKNDEVTRTAGTGPDGDHTSGIGKFLYTEASTHGDQDLRTSGIAYFESPCIDLAGNDNARMSYWYYRYGVQSDMGSLSTQIYLDSNNYDDTTFRNVKRRMGSYRIDSTQFDVSSAEGLRKIDSTLNSYFNRWFFVGTVISGTQQASEKDNWLHRTIDLSQYAGQRILVRFRATSGGGIAGDMAIDDILFYEASSTDVAVVNVTQPVIDGCAVGERNIIAQVRNYGLDTIYEGEVGMRYIIRGDITNDVIQERIDPQETILFTFGDRVDLREYSGVQNIVVEASLTGDTITGNNSAYREVVNRRPGLPRYFMDFENHSQGAIGGIEYANDDLQGWKRNFTPNLGPSVYGWHVQCGEAPWIDAEAFYAPNVGPATGPNGDHTFSRTERNGEGCYLLVESDVFPVPFIVQDALIELPCGNIDFSKSANGKVLLSFWYHMYGAGMGDLFVDVNNGVEWINRVDAIRGQKQFDDTERWRRHEISLDSFAANGNDDIRIRIRAEFNDRGGDIAIDDIELLDRARNDARIDRIIDPESDCDLTNAEDFKVRFQNVGVDDILETVMGYQITFYPFNCNGGGYLDPIVGDIEKDTVVGPLAFAAPLAFQDVEFEDVDLSSPGRYEFKIWTEIEGDVNYFNDTLVEIVVNETRPFDCCEDFSDMTYGQLGKQFRDGKFPNRWEGNTAAYTFKVERQDGGIAGAGNTGRANDAYFLANDPDGQPGQIARIESPCYDLTNASAAILEFYYQAPNPNHVMVIEVQQVGAGAWQELDRLEGLGLFGVARWTKETIVLSDYIGSFVKVRFRAVNQGAGYYAIDDFCIKSPPPQQIQLERFVTPQRGLCFYSDQEQVTLRVQNIGLDRINSFDIELTVDKSFQNFPPGQYLRETVTVDVSNSVPAFDPGVKLDITLNLPRFIVDMLDKDIYYFNAYVSLDGDIDESNNLIEDYPVQHVVPIELPYIEDFELVRGEGAVGLYTNGIGQTVSGMAFWEEENRLEPFRDGLTGPNKDHTKDSDEGTYMILNGEAGELGHAAILTTRCIDLRFAINPEMRYWYHMFGFQMGNLSLQINDDSGWEEIDLLQGPDRDQRGHDKDWKSRTIDLKDYKGKVVRLRFVGTRGNGSATGMAIDDISVYDLAAKDISPISLNDPTGDSSYCYTIDQKVKVNLRNNGSQPIDFEADTTIVSVVILKGPDANNLAILKTLKDTITENIFRENGIGPLQPLPRDSVACYALKDTFDMTDYGQIYRFNVLVETKGDLINRNDEYRVDVLSQIVGGITKLTINPDNSKTICFGEQVELEAKNYFGELGWEEKIVLPDGTGEWFPGIFGKLDEKVYTPSPDTTTDYRVRICGTKFISRDPDFAVYSDSFRIEVVKPRAPIAFDFDTCGIISQEGIALDSVLFDQTGFSFSARVQDFVDDINPYETDFQSVGNNPREPKDTVAFNFLENNGSTNNILRGNVPSSVSDTFWLEAVTFDSRVPSGVCYSVNRTPIVGTINTPPRPRFDYDSITVCQDTAFRMDAGKVEYETPDEDGNTRFYRATYAWSIYMPDGSVIDTSNSDSAVLQNQTLVVDAYLLNLNQTYGYSVSIATEAGCDLPGTPIKYVTIVDSCVTSIAEIAFQENFNIYPNPVSDELFIIHNSSENFTGNIIIMSVEGQIIETYNELGFGNLNQKIDMGTLPKGIYFIKIETEKGSFVEKIIKN